MMPDPFFSIITPAFNRAVLLPKAIESVLGQTFKSFEYIIIDDASTDNTKEVVESFKDDRIIYSKNEKNLERGASRNKGIELSKGKYICFLDSDDEYCSNHLQILYDHIIKEQLPAMFFANSYLVMDGGEPSEKMVPDIAGWDIFRY
jgi:glycosyltransferase involved in cell wall biosynthesis